MIEYYLDLIRGEQAGGRVRKECVVLPRIGDTLYTHCSPYTVTGVHHLIDEPTKDQEDRIPLVIAESGKE